MAVTSVPAEIPFEILRGEQAAREFAEMARAEGRVALDTEFWWERTYAPVLCLLQAATRERIVVIDPLEEGVVSPISELVVDPAVQIVMHAPAADLLLFALREDARATNVFDTQVVAGFAGLRRGRRLRAAGRGRARRTAAAQRDVQRLAPAPALGDAARLRERRRALPVRRCRTGCASGSRSSAAPSGPRTSCATASATPRGSSPILRAPG